MMESKLNDTVNNSNSLNESKIDNFTTKIPVLISEKYQKQLLYREKVLKIPRMRLRPELFDASFILHYDSFFETENVFSKSLKQFIRNEEDLLIEDNNKNTLLHYASYR